MQRGRIGLLIFPSGLSFHPHTVQLQVFPEAMAMAMLVVWSVLKPPASVVPLAGGDPAQEAPQGHPTQPRGHAEPLSRSQVHDLRAHEPTGRVHLPARPQRQHERDQHQPCESQHTFICLFMCLFYFHIDCSVAVVRLGVLKPGRQVQ